MRSLTGVLFMLLLAVSPLFSQQRTLVMTLDDVIETAREQSQDALIAKHSFLSSYWSYRSYKAQLLPSLNLNSTLGQYNRTLSQVQNSETGEINYVENNSLYNSLSLSIDQNIPFTGGNVSVYTSLNRLDQFSPFNEGTWNTQPINIQYTQPIRGFNTLKWEKKIEPKRYEMAKQDYLGQMESITVQATTLFFDLLLAQSALDMARKNHESTEFSYKIANERYAIGMISKSDLLQLNLRLLNNELSISEAELDLRVKLTKLRTYLGYNENVDIELVVPEIKSSLTLDYDDVLYRTLTNSSFALENEISILEAQQEVARAKSEVGLQATLHATFGLNQVDERFKNAYMNLLDQEVLGLTLSMPILDWGLSKGRVKVAKSLNDVVEMEVAQKEQEMREDIMFRVLQFNLQSQQCSVSAQADSIGRQRYENTRERFLNGTATVTDLNTAQTEMDDAITNYLNALGNYWKYYYEIRQLALYDYMNDRMLAEDFDKLVENEY